MKPFLIYILTIFIGITTSNVDGKYKIIDELKDDTLFLKKNGKFIYEVRGGSCWTWRDYSGNWIVKQDTLVLSENRKFVTMDENYENVIEEGETKIEHKFLIIKNGLVTITTDLVSGNKKYKKL